MSDLCDDQFIHDNIYTNTYSLWGNSKYYDIKNLSPQNFANRNGTIGSEISQEFKASRWSSGPSGAKAPEPPDSRNRRTIDRESLYEDPESFNKEASEESPIKSPSFDWTQFYWHKATEKVQEGFLDPGPSRGRKQQVLGASKIQKKLDKMLAKPVKMTKAENMMQKMGWQGGALGRTGDGIVEPIAPNAVYAIKKIGFGQNHILRPPRNKKADSKQFYDTNVLLNIFEFVKNNSEVELLFDRNLKKEERKRIHQLVQYKLKADDFAAVEFDSTAQMDLVLQISDKNCYILHTQSSGIHPTRQLCLYKAAPPHVYLIIPDDLKDQKEGIFFSEGFSLDTNEEEILEVEISKDVEIELPKVIEEPPIVPEEPLNVLEELEPEEETNPFLISITRNLKKKSDSECQEDEVVPEVQEVPEVEEIPEDPVPVLPEDPIPVPPEMSKIMTKIVEYFDDFAGDKKFSQFKFLGPFNDEELSAINEFIEQAVIYLSKEGECPFASIFEKIAFEINEDCTGNTVIYKRPV